MLRDTRDLAVLTPIPVHSPADECGTHVIYMLADASAATQFAQAVGGVVAGRTGRHVYTEWDPVFAHQGAHHPALNPYNLAENRACRMTYTRDMCAPSLDILNRTVMLRLDPFAKRAAVDQLVARRTGNPHCA